jgi:hypothetical protein
VLALSIIGFTGRPTPINIFSAVFALIKDKTSLKFVRRSLYQASETVVTSYELIKSIHSLKVLKPVNESGRTSFATCDICSH